MTRDRTFSNFQVMGLGSYIGPGPLTSSQRRVPGINLNLSIELLPTMESLSAVEELSHQLQLLNERQVLGDKSLIKLLREEGTFK